MLDWNNCNILFDFKVSLQSHFCRKTLQSCHSVRNVVIDVITFPENLKTLVVWRFIAWRYFTHRRDVIMIKIRLQLGLV